MTPKRKQCIIFTVIFGILALICFAGGVPQSIALLKGPIPYENTMEKLLVPDQEDELGKIYTSVTIDNLYGPFDEKVNYTTSTNRYGIESTTKSTAFNYIFKIPNEDHIFQIDAYNIPTKKKLGEFAEAYQAYVNGESAEKPEPIVITGTFERFWDNNKLESVIWDAVPIPEGGYILPEDKLLEIMQSHGVNISTLPEKELEEKKQSYRDAYKEPSQASWTDLLTINYKFVADRFDNDTYLSYHISLIGFIFMCTAIAAFWAGYFRWKKISAKQNLSLENATAHDDYAPSLNNFTPGKSCFIGNEAERISVNRKKEVKKSYNNVILGVILFGLGIFMAVMSSGMLGSVFIFMSILISITALIRSKKITADRLAIEKELFLELMIKDMTSEQLDTEMRTYNVSGPVDPNHNYYITDNFVIQRFPMSTVVVNLNRVLWIGGTFTARNAKNTERGAMLYDGTGPVDEHTKEGYSRVRSDYYVEYYGVDGEPIFDHSKHEIKTITGNEMSTKILLKALHETHPWIFMGREQMKYLKADMRPEAVKLWKQKRSDMEQQNEPLT